MLTGERRPGHAEGGTDQSGRAGTDNENDQRNDEQIGAGRAERPEPQLARGQHRQLRPNKREQHKPAVQPPR
jgi:hypothetical protein